MRISDWSSDVCSSDLVKDMTTGAEMETWLNEKYGEESQLYRDLARLITAGADEDWAENLEVGGLSYRRSRILEAAPETFQFSITAVYMNSSEDKPFKYEEDKACSAVTATDTLRAKSTRLFHLLRACS